MTFPHYDVKSVVEILNENDFSLSAEIIPPRNGTDFHEVFSILEKLKEAGFDFISVTHGAGGSLRGGTLPISYHAQTHFGLTAIAHLTCRNMTKEDLENVLIDHHYFGVRNILALRGDPPDGIGAEFHPVEGGFQYAYELIELIQRLNEGKYLPRKNFDEGDFRPGIKTQFCIGAACYPEDPKEVRLKYLKRKIEAGAQFAISQMVLDETVFEKFYKEVLNEYGHSFPILPGIRVPSSSKQLKRMKDKFGIRVSKKLMKEMIAAEEAGKNPKEIGIRWAVEFTQFVRKLGIRGVHFFIMNDVESAILVKKRLSF